MKRLLPLLALALGGGCGDDERRERQLFLKRFRDYAEARDGGQPAALEALGAMHPRTEAVRDAHSVCVAAATGIARAEREHDRAEKLLAEVQSGRRTLDATQAEIQRAIQASSAAAEGARSQIDRCFRLVDGLKLGRE